MSLDNSNIRVGINTNSPGYTLDVNGTAHCTSGAWSSDARLKENIRPIEKPLEKILALNGVIFEWNNSDPEINVDSKTHMGFIAQDVESVIPDVVWSDSKYKSVAYTEIIPMLVEAIKELKDEVDKLKGINK